MPRVQPIYQVAQLQQQSLGVFTHFLRVSLSRRPLTDTEIATIERYLKIAFPATKLGLVLKALATSEACYCQKQGRGLARSRRGTKSQEDSSSSHRCLHSYICNRSRLASAFGETDLCFHYNMDTSTLMSMWDLRDYKKVKFKLPSSYGDQSFNYFDRVSVTAFTHNLLNYVCTMTNVVHFEINVCPPKLLALVSRSCPSLETLILPQILDCEQSIVGLCGYRPKKLTKAEATCGNQKTSFTVCTGLQLIKLGNSDVSLDCVALLLNVFPELRNLQLRRSCSLADALMRIYGTDSSRYDSIRKKYKIMNVTEGYPRSEDQWSLLVQVCPDLSSITMVLGGAGRYDKNVLAELQPLTHLTCLRLHSVHMDSLFWFLGSSGRSLKHLAVFNNFPASDSWDTFSRSHLQRLAEYCPNLVTLNIFTANFRLVRDIDHYEADSPRFQSLRYLQLNFKEDSLLELQDIQLLLASSSLTFVLFRNLLPLSDVDCDVMLRLPFFKMAQTFYHGGLISGAKNLDKFLEACPQLERTEQHLKWSADTEHLRNRISQKNWFLSCELESVNTCEYCLVKENFLV